MLVMICCVLFARRQPLSALLLPAMLIAYNLATCAVLSSSTDFRFFLSTPMLAPLCVVGLMGERHGAFAPKPTRELSFLDLPLLIASR